MLTFTVPPTVEPDESPVYVAVAGELRPWKPWPRTPHPGFHPPSALVALLDPCKTCGGKKGSVTIHNVGTPNVWAYEQECPDCHGSGSTLVTLQQECGACIATNPDLCTVCHKPPGRNRNGLVSLPGLYRLTELLPLIDCPNGGYPPSTPTRFAYVSRPGSLRIVDHSDPSDTYICSADAVHGTLEPGGYVVCFIIHSPHASMHGANQTRRTP